jgi:hypothetical protein
MDGEYIEDQNQNTQGRKKKNEETLDANHKNRISRFKGDDSEPELEAEDDDEVFNTRDSNFDTMYN